MTMRCETVLPLAPVRTKTLALPLTQGLRPFADGVIKNHAVRISHFEIVTTRNVDLTLDT